MKKDNIFLLIALLATVACARTTCETDQVVCEQYIHKYGVEVECKDWNTRGKDGKVVSTMSSGVTVCKSYVAGELDGETTYTYPHSNVVKRSELYAKGTLVKELEFNSYGIPAKEIEHQSPE